MLFYNHHWPIEAEWRIYASVNYPSLLQIIACRLVGVKVIILTGAGILLIRTLGTNFSEILSEMHTF